MDKPLKFVFVGGDKRFVYAAEEVGKSGCRAEVANDYEAMIIKVKEADIVVLPLPMSRDGVFLSGTDIKIRDLARYLKNEVKVFAGRATESFCNLCAERKIKVIDYSKSDEFEILNAVPTAEGAIETAIKNTDFTVYKSRCLVCGYGRIGKVLTDRLRALGAEVYASARKPRDLAEIRTRGIGAVRSDMIADKAEKFDIIFNTVPALILDKEVLKRTKKDVFICDLASLPGGVDFAEAESLGRKAVSALGLPGKTAPRTAGAIIKETIFNLLERMEV